MKTRQLLSKYLFGLTIPQQYVCLSLEDLSNPLKVTLTSKENQIAIPIAPVFIGYKPVVFALVDHAGSLNEKEYCLNFYSHADFQVNSTWREFPTDKDSVARLVVTVFPLRFKMLPDVKLFKAERGEHTFISAIYRTMNFLREKFDINRPGNVSLPGNLHDMVRIAYSIPRTIALVSMGDGEKMNLFPTDLHGQLDNTFYISSLRIGGNAQRQVEQLQKIVLCEIESRSFRDVYALGKNHVKDFASVSEFDLSTETSERFKFPLPKTTLRYFELTVLTFAYVGIHRLFLYRIENKVSMRQGKTLGHIHQYYAEWRKRKALKTDLLLR